MLTYQYNNFKIKYNEKLGSNSVQASTMNEESKKKKKIQWNETVSVKKLCEILVDIA